MISVSIVNVTSYTGLELLRLLSQHPQFRVSSVTARSAVGKRLYEVFPQLSVMTNTQIDPQLVITEEPGQIDLAFVCLPHAAAAESVVTLLERGTKVVDLSADFRTFSNESHPSEPTYIEITFQEGIPIALNGEDIDGVTLIETLNKLAGGYGIGRIDHIENRLVGIK